MDTVPTRKYLFTNCKEQMTKADKERTIAPPSTHTFDANRNRVSVPGKSEKLTRPKITQGTLVNPRNSGKAIWILYKTGTSISEAGHRRQPIGDCNEEPTEQLPRADPSLSAKPENGQLDLINKLAETPAARRCAGMPNAPQRAGDRPQARPAKVWGKAATCEIGSEYAEEYRREKEGHDTIVKNVLGNGLANAEVWRKALGGKPLDEIALLDTIACAKQEKIPRNAPKDEAAVEEAGRKKQATSSLTDEAKLRKKVKCRECETQITQCVQLRPGKPQEHKRCKQGGKRSTQKRDTKGPKTEADKKEKETAILLVPGNLSMSCQNMGTDKAVKEGRTHRKRTLENNRKVLRPDNAEAARTRLRTHTATVPERRILEPDTGRAQLKAWRQPKPQRSAHGGVGSKLSFTAPSTAPGAGNSAVDTRAQARMRRLVDGYTPGCKKQDPARVKRTTAPACRQPADSKGAAPPTSEVNQLATSRVALITPSILGLHPSRHLRPSKRTAKIFCRKTS